MKKIILILLVSSCVTPAPDPVEQERQLNEAISDSEVKSRESKCHAGMLSYIDENGVHMHVISPGPNRVALVKCDHEPR